MICLASLALVVEVAVEVVVVVVVVVSVADMDGTPAIHETVIGHRGLEELAIWLVLNWIVLNCLVLGY